MRAAAYAGCRAEARRYCHRPAAYCLLLLVLQHATRSVRARGIDGGSVLIDVLDHAFLIDDEGRAIGESVFLVEDPVRFGHCPLKITQEREFHADLLGVGLVGG